MPGHRIFASAFAGVYPHYVQKAEKKNRTKAEVDEIICWLTGYDLAGLLCGYGFAWIGHFAFEKNQPASFKQPLYSFMGDWKMYWQILSGRIAF